MLRLTRRYILLHCLALAFIGTAHSQNSTAHTMVEFLPGPLLVPPLTASYQEPRLGVRKEIGTSRLKLDIGNAIDLLEVRPSNDSTERMRIGAEFFTYALTTNSEGFRLQVDALDGFFGGHIIYRKDLPSSMFVLRLRLMHLSSHLVDGHFSPLLHEWNGGKQPLPYTRDFGELMASYSWTGHQWGVQLYSGFSYAVKVRPSTLRRVATLHGAEWHDGRIIGSLFGKPCNLYAADHFTLSGIPAWAGSNNLEGGVKLGPWSGTGVRLYVTYYRGLDVFNQYYNERSALWALGFAIDFW